jgi:hypothetical protein
MTEFKPVIVDTSDAWERMLKGERVPIQLNDPMPGYYERRLVKGGPMVACRIWIEEERDELNRLMADQRYRCLVDGRTRDAFDQWSWLASHPISKEEYEFRTRDAAWCREHAPDEPRANPTERIDINRTRPIF